MPKYTVRHDKKAEIRGFLRSDGKLALGVALGSLGILLLFVTSEFLWGSRALSEYFTAAPLIISLLVASASTYFSANALLEQRRAREASTDPVLIAHLGQRIDARELVTFNVTNVGAGAALNIILEVDLPDEDEDTRSKRQFLRHIFARHHPISVIL